MKRVLLIQTAFIGDAILATAALSSLKSLDFQVDVLVRRGNEIFFQDHPDCEHVLIWDKKGALNKYRSLLNLLKTVRHNGYYGVINLQRFAATGFLTAFSGAGYRIGFKQNPLSFLFSHSKRHTVKERFHEKDRNLELIHLAFNQAQACQPNLHLSQDLLHSVAQYQGKKYICLFPGSVWFTKRLSNPKWVELIGMLPKEYTIYFLGAPNEWEMCNSIIEMSKVFHGDMINLCGKMSLMQSAALGQGATMNYCNDSSPVHFLSAVNAPVSAFFLSTDPIFGFYPISQQSYIQKVDNLSCKPCGMVGKAACPEGHFNCNNHLEIQTHLH